jgi:two-component system cell cycle sensor histidine kinase/response regulator CckA
VTSRSILIVDDEAVVRAYIVRALRMLGFEVVEASDGPSAWQLTLDRTFDLIITDNRMPGMSGKELTRRVREHYPDTRILCVSGSQDTPAEDDPWIAHLRKPFGIDELVDRVQVLLHKG